MRPGDVLMFTDWRGDPDQRLDGEGTEVGTLLCRGGREGRDRPRPHLAVAPGSPPVLRTGEPPPGRGDQRRRWVLPARHAGAARRLAPPEVRRAASSRPASTSTAPSSAGSTCATAAAMTPATAETPRRSRWRRCTGPAHPGTTSSSTARASGGRRRNRLPGTVGRPVPALAQPDPPGAGPVERASPGGGTFPPATADPSPCGSQARAGPAHVSPATAGRFRSRPRGSAVWPGASPKRWAGPAAWCTWKTSTCGRARRLLPTAEPWRLSPSCFWWRSCPPTQTRTGACRRHPT